MIEDLENRPFYSTQTLNAVIEEGYTDVCSNCVHVTNLALEECQSCTMKPSNFKSRGE